MMRNNPQRVAWLVLIGAFAFFLMLCAAVPVSARSYLLYSTSPRQAVFEVIGGTPRVWERGSPAPIAVTQPITLSEGSTIETDENSRGIVTLVDGSTLTLFPSTIVTLRQMQESRFDWGRMPITFSIDEERGRIRVGAAPLYAPASATAHARVFRVQTPHLLASLAEGSFAIDVTTITDSSQVTANYGTAEVTAYGNSVSIGQGQRTVVLRGNPPLPPLPAAQDLMVNGDFKDPIVRGWNNLPNLSGQAIPPGSWEVTPFGDRQTVHIFRGGSGQTSAITGIIQQINREVSDFRTLRLTADIRLQFQNLSGGGVLSSEYPLILRLRYRDVYGSEAEWVHGFYYQNTTNNPTNNGELAPNGVWVPYESGNLLDLADPRPFYITSIQIYASGWDYDSYVSNVRLIVE